METEFVNKKGSPEWIHEMAQTEEFKTIDADLQNSYAAFERDYGPDVLAELNGVDLLRKVFINDTASPDNLCHQLEFGKNGWSGSIAGGSSFKYGLFFHKRNRQWTTGAPTKPVILSEEEAAVEGKQIVDNLLECVDIIRNSTLETEEDYETLGNKLSNVPGSNKVWFLKYFHMVFPDKIPPYYTEFITAKVIKQLGLPKRDSIFRRFAEIKHFAKSCNVSLIMLDRIFWRYLYIQDEAEDSESENSLSDLKNSSIRYWIYSPGDQAMYWDEFYKQGIIAIGWEEIGDIKQYSSKAEIRQALKDKFGGDTSFVNATHAVWQFAYEMKPGDIVFAKKGKSILVGRGIVESDYVFDSARSTYNNIRKIKWTHHGEWPHPGQAVLKTLTDITPYTDYVEKLNALFEDNGSEDVEEKEIIYPEYTAEDFLNTVYMDKSSYEMLVALIKTKKNVILQGAPGVGKTYAAKRLAYSIMGEKNQDRVMMVQFHQSYSYEDFIMGFRPSAEGFELKKGAFYNFCKKAEIDSDNDYFFIIDEINRGNLSKIFGELFMLIENDKRGIELQLLYSDELFAVPKNVYIIGMMNTADRSLALLDYALRRRFSFFEMKPGFETEGFRNYRMNLKSEKFDRLIASIESLNNAIAADDSLGEGFCIGHSYFCNLTSVSDDVLTRIIEFEIIPLIKEYWFDEPTKVKDWINILRSSIK